MCGRYSITTNHEAIKRLFQVSGGANWWRPRYNVAPTQDAPVIRLNDAGQRELVQLRWGLVPHWAKDLKIGYKTINARAETVARSPAFQDAFRSRRCLVLTDGFYEWQPQGDTKQPFRIVMKHREPFALAGLWERWGPRENPTETFTIIVTEANELCAAIHNRMPVVIDRADYDSWLRAEAGGENLLRPYPADRMEAYPVSTRVNSHRNDDEDVIALIAPRLL
jgi:putative SOS response-associated peptidase YedK